MECHQDRKQKTVDLSFPSQPKKNLLCGQISKLLSQIEVTGSPKIAQPIPLLHLCQNGL